MGLSGCASSGIAGLTLPPQLLKVSAETVGSVPSPSSAAVATVDASDWEAVRRAIATIPADQAKSLEWSNPDTRSTGAVSVAVAAEPEAATACRSFATTVSDARGVRRFRGQACREVDGRWQLRGVSADDATLS
jgi:surface antigen